MRHDDTRCPVCGDGVFVDVSYLDPDRERGEDEQASESFEVLTFSCGHEVRGPELAVADTERLTVEERTAEETVDRPTSRGGTP
jgi:hypothetical protein